MAPSNKEKNMKKTSFIIAFLLIVQSAMFAQAGINTNGSAPDNSAMLDVNSASLDQPYPLSFEKFQD